MQACNVNSPDNSQKLVKILLDVRAHVDISNQVSFIFLIIIYFFVIDEFQLIIK